MIDMATWQKELQKDKELGLYKSHPINYGPRDYDECHGEKAEAPVVVREDRAA